jgi:hypothetical protein
MREAAPAVEDEQVTPGLAMWLFIVVTLFAAIGIGAWLSSRVEDRKENAPLAWNEPEPERDDYLYPRCEHWSHYRDREQVGWCFDCQNWTRPR